MKGFLRFFFLIAGCMICALAVIAFATFAIIAWIGGGLFLGFGLSAVAVVFTALLVAIIEYKWPS